MNFLILRGILLSTFRASFIFAITFLSDTEYPSCSVLPGDEPAFYQDLGVIREREDSRRVAELANLMKETYDGSRTFEVSREDRRKIWDRCESNNRNYK